MNEAEIIVGLDVGTTKVCTVVGMLNPEQKLEIIGVGHHPSYGLRKGAVVNVQETVASIQHSIKEAKTMAGVDFSKVTVGIAGGHIYSFNSTGVVAIKTGLVTQEDVNEVIEAAKAVVIPSDREILHVIPQEFRLDGTKGIKSPVGMHGVRLEVSVHVVTGAISLIQNLVKCIESTGHHVQDIVLQPLASGLAVLDHDEKELGVAIVDIGGGTTDLAVWKYGSLIHSEIIPVGGNHFTSDIAVGLKVPHTEAERIKTNHGSVIPTTDTKDQIIKVKGLTGMRERDIALGHIHNILNARANELLGLVNRSLRDRGLINELSGGIVITGGGSLVRGISELCEFMTECPCKIGHPRPLGGMTSVMQGPKYSTVIGLLNQAVNTKGKQEKTRKAKMARADILTRLSESLRSVFRDIF